MLPSTYVPSGFIRINDIMDNAKAALLLPHPANRAEQQFWKNLLDGVNNEEFSPNPVIFYLIRWLMLISLDKKKENCLRDGRAYQKVKILLDIIYNNIRK